MPSSISDLDALITRLRHRAQAAGFEAMGIASAQAPDTWKHKLEAFIAAGHHGEMGWLADTVERRASPNAMWPAAKSAIVLAANYGPDHDPLEDLAHVGRASISVYARNRDYHDILKGRLKQLAGWFASQSGADVKVFVDTAPLMEKPLAQAAGLGWQGKHTNLVSQDFGSWLFLGSILTDAALPESTADTDHCGRCSACLDICPTNAFPAPYQLDARRCISYLTIEHKGHIAREFRQPMGNRIYGCDDCLAVCPWNKFAQIAAEPGFHPRPELTAPALEDLLGLDDASFRQVFSASPIKRIGRDRFIRNVLIAAGNSALPGLIPAVRPHLDDPSPLVRAMAVWALAQLCEQTAWAQLRRDHARQETDSDVREEWAVRA